jgi:protein SCO1/2
MRCVNIMLVTILILLAAQGLASTGEATAEPSHESEHSPRASDHQSHDHESMEMESTSGAEVAVDEKLGDRIPLDVVFLDEQGRELPIGTAITKPTLLLPVYFSCPATCSIMLANLAQAINDVPLELGKDYGVLAVSFDEEEGPELARGAKHNFTKILKEGLPREEWRFLTGEKENILALTEGIGFRFKRTGKHLFIHPNVLVALAPDGTIIRYLYGPRFLPFDIGMALTEAAKGTPGLSIRKLLTYCFDYDPASKRYMVRSFRLMALGIVALLAVLFFFVVRKR